VRPGVRLHWVTESVKRRDRIAAAVGRLDSARDKGIVSRDLVIDFARSGEEPMLWLPDAVAGAVTASVLGDNRWLEPLSDVLTRHSVVVR
jgi:hypothetical protein